MPQYYREVFASKGEISVYKDENGKKEEFTTVLLGSWLGVIDEDHQGWLKVIFYDEEGWVQEVDTSPESCLKIFFVDVGQGDACLIESPSKRILVCFGSAKFGPLMIFSKFWFDYSTTSGRMLNQV